MSMSYEVHTSGDTFTLTVHSDGLTWTSEPVKLRPGDDVNEAAERAIRFLIKTLETEHGTRSDV